MAKIDVTKISGYESMTPEQKVEALQNYEYDDFSEENKKLKLSVDKASADASKYKKQYQDKLTETEKAEMERAERDKAIQDELNEYRTKNRLSNYQAKLMESGYDTETAKELAKQLPEGLGDDYFNIQKKFFENQKAKQDKKDLENTPEITGGKTPDPKDTDNLSDEEYFDNYFSKKK